MSVDTAVLVLLPAMDAVQIMISIMIISVIVSSVSTAADIASGELVAAAYFH